MRSTSLSQTRRIEDPDGGRLRGGLGWAAGLVFASALLGAQQTPAPPPAGATPATPAPEQAAPPAAAIPAEAPAPQPVPEKPKGPPVRVLRTGGLKMETAALLLSGQQGGPLPFAVLAFPAAQEGETVRVPVLVEVDGTGLLDEHAGNPVHLEVSLYALGGTGGNVQGAFMETVEVDLDRLEETVSKSGIKFLGELALPPGDYSLRVLVRNPATDNVGLKVLPLTVPAFDAAGARTVLSPLFAEAAGSWLPVRALALRNRPAPLAPLAVLAGDELPAARPILVLDKETSFQVAAYGLEPAADLRLELRRPSGQLAADFPVRVTGRQPAGIPGLEILTAAFQPRGIEPGEFELRVVIPGAGADFRSYATTAVVSEQDVGGRVWAEFTRSAREQERLASGAAAAARQEERSPSARRGKLDSKAVEDAYRAALRQLGTGDEKGARAAVSALETSLLVEKNLLGQEVAGALFAVARQLAQSQPEALVPVILLHEQLYREYVERNSYALSSHAREMVFALTALYVKHNNSEPARELAARFILGLAAEFPANAPRVLRSRAFRRVLEYDPDNEIALLCLAIDAERHAEYAAAVDYLEKLLKKDPKHLEARVRLALNRARLGGRREARKMFEEVVEGEARGAGTPPVWLLAVAYQELARLLLEAHELQAAERVVRAGLERLPDDEKLSLQLALVLDLRKDRKEARSVLEAVKPKATPRGFDSARRRYTQLPAEVLERERAGLQQSAAERLRSLAAAVPGAGAKGGMP